MAAEGLTLDPLMAEAKRRARRRRLLLAAVLVILAALALGAVDALTGNGSAPPTLSPAATSQPPLSGLAARAVWCGDAYNASGRGGCHSPDGKWAIVVDNEGRAAR